MAGYWCSRVPDLEADIQIDVPRLVSLETCFTFVVCCEPRSFKACSKSGSISHRVKTLLRNPNAAHYTESIGLQSAKGINPQCCTVLHIIHSSISSGSSH